MPELSRITDTLKSANGVLLSGWIVIQPSEYFTAADGTAVAGGPFEYQVIGGVVEIDIVPTEDAAQEVTYRAEYEISGMAKYTETWSVGRAADGPFTISQVRGTG